MDRRRILQLLGGGVALTVLGTTHGQARRKPRWWTTTTTSSTTTSTTANTIPPGLPTQTQRFVMNMGGGSYDAALVARTHDYFIANAWDWPQIATLKQYNPNIRCLVYKCMSSARTTGSVNGLYPTGITYEEANANNWWLRRPDGSLNQWGAFPGHYQLDIGLAAVQQRWTQRVAAEVTQNGWDGVFMDNALTRIYAYNPYDITTNKYTSDASWQAAYRSALVGMTPALRSVGKVCVPNIQEPRLLTGLVADWLTLTDGYMAEFFWGWSPRDNDLVNMREAERQGKLSFNNGFTFPGTSSDESYRQSKAAFDGVIATRKLYNFQDSPYRATTARW